MSEINFHNGELREYSYQRDRRLRRSILTEWRDAGYYRGQHLRNMTHAGDPGVLRLFHELESVPSSPYPFAAWLAERDMSEIVNEFVRLGRSAYTGQRVRVPSDIVKRVRLPSNGVYNGN